MDQLGEGHFLPDAIMDLGHRSPADLRVPADEIGRCRAFGAFHSQRGRAVGEVKDVSGRVNPRGVAQKTGPPNRVLEDQHCQQAVHIPVARSRDAPVVQAREAQAWETSRQPAHARSDAQPVGPVLGDELVQREARPRGLDHVLPRRLDHALRLVEPALGLLLHGGGVHA